MTTRTMYLHTIDGEPATWSDQSEQIVYADDDAFRGRRQHATLRRSLREIRRDQERTRANRKAWGFGDERAMKYGYVLVEVPV